MFDKMDPEKQPVSVNAEGEEEEHEVAEADIDEVVHLEEGAGDEPMDEDDEDGAEGDDDQMGDLPSGSGQQFEDTSIAACHAHKDSVFSISLHPSFPNPPLAVSGGADDVAYVWSTHDGEPVAKLDNHTDSVVTAAFNARGNMVATGGMDGRVNVWKAAGTDDAPDYTKWEPLAALEGPDEVVWIEWHPTGNVIAAGSTDSTVWLWTLPLGKTMQVFSGHTGAVTTGSWTANGKRLVTGSEDGSLIVWDPRSPAPAAKLQASDARFNLEGGITKLRIAPDARTVIVGGAAGDVRIVSIARVDDEGTMNVVAALDGHTPGESVEAIEFIDLTGGAAASNDRPVTTVVTGASDGKGFVWDTSNGKMRNAVSHDAAITSVVVHPGTTLFSTSSADHTIKTWDARTAACVATNMGFTDGILALAAGKDDGYTQGAETGGIGAYAQGVQRGFKLVGAGDEGIALVFRV